MEKERDTFLLCLSMIEERLHWGDRGSWSNQDFENLSEKITDKTQVRLSVSTLKRICGKVKYESSPTLATKDALARFLDYENWREFEFQNRISSAPVVAETPQRKRRPAMTLIASAMILIIVSVAILFLAGKEQSASPHDVVFKSHEVTDDLPNSVIFDYDVSGLPAAKEVFIQQSWDPERRKRVSLTGTQHTSVYYYPGYFTAKLIVDNNVEKEHPVFIKTKGWLGIINMRQIPAYLSPTEIKLTTGLGINAATLTEKISSPVFNNNWVSFCNVRDFGNLQGNDFSVETSVRNTSTITESLCRHVRVVVLGKISALIVPLSVKGCVSSNDLLTGDGWILGKENDMTAFSCTFADFERVKCTVKNGRLNIFLNDTLIKALDQKNSIGDVVGVRIEFEGAGEIRDIRLSSSSRVVYEENFAAGPF